MNKIKTFEEFLSNGSAQFSISNFLLNLLISAILAYILSIMYDRYGASLSNRKSFGKNFVLLAVTTMIIITIVKSSLALSLGLVGALSIVRFRTAIKEPEELTYLFLNIAIGLGLGADQKAITLIGFSFLILFLLGKKVFYKKSFFERQNLIVIVNSTSPTKTQLTETIDVLKAHCLKVDLKRFDENSSDFEASFVIEFETLEELNNIKLDLQKSFDNLTISFIDNNINV